MCSHWPIRTVVFDLDDTLFAEREFVLSGFRVTDEWIKSNLGIEGFAEASARFFNQGIRGTIFDAALEAIGCVPSRTLVKQLVTVYRAHCPVISVFPDAARFLASTWRPQLALLSDGFIEVQRRKLEALAIGSFFSCIVFTDAFGRDCWKPSPVGFRHVMTQLGESADKYVYVADNPHKDFIAPRALGWRTVRIRRQGGEHAGYEPLPAEAADYEISSLDQLMALFG